MEARIKILNKNVNQYTLHDPLHFDVLLVLYAGLNDAAKSMLGKTHRWVPAKRIGGSLLNKFPSYARNRILISITHIMYLTQQLYVSYEEV